MPKATPAARVAASGQPARTSTRAARPRLALVPSSAPPDDTAPDGTTERRRRVNPFGDVPFSLTSRTLWAEFRKIPDKFTADVFAVLCEHMEYGGTIKGSPSALAKHMGAHRQHFLPALAALESLGLIRRTRGNADKGQDPRRITRLALNPHLLGMGDGIEAGQKGWQATAAAGHRAVIRTAKGRRRATATATHTASTEQEKGNAPRPC